MDRKLMLLMVTPPFHDPGIAPNPLKAAHTMILSYDADLGLGEIGAQLDRGWETLREAIMRGAAHEATRPAESLARPDVLPPPDEPPF